MHANNICRYMYTLSTTVLLFHTSTMFLRSLSECSVLLPPPPPPPPPPPHTHTHNLSNEDIVPVTSHHDCTAPIIYSCDTIGQLPGQSIASSILISGPAQLKTETSKLVTMTLHNKDRETEQLQCLGMGVTFGGLTDS